MSIFPTKVLLATDGSKEADLAAKTALSLVQKTGSELHVVHVLYWASERALDPEGLDPALCGEVEGRARKRLEDLVGTIESSGVKVTGSHLRVGRPDAEIIAQAEEISAGLIVMGSRGFGMMRRAMMGSVSDSVVRHAHCPVMVVRGNEAEFPTRILVATDGSDEAKLAASSAADLTKSTNSELHIVCVGHVPTILYESPEAIVLDADVQSKVEEDSRKDTETKLERQVQGMRDAGIEVAEAHTSLGDPDAEIVGLAGKIECRPDSHGQSRAWTFEKGFDGKCL